MFGITINILGIVVDVILRAQKWQKCNTDTYLHVFTVQCSEVGGVNVGELPHRPQQSWTHKHKSVTLPTFIHKSYK